MKGGKEGRANAKLIKEGAGRRGGNEGPRKEGMEVGKAQRATCWTISSHCLH